MAYIIPACRNWRESSVNLLRIAFPAASCCLLIAGIVCFASTSAAQTVSHPVSELSTTARHYSYAYILSATQKKDIEYILVKASNGDVKSVFNACDVCYNAHKGYSQTGMELRCNNCGNRFAIDGLGGQSTGGTCNPGYLPHAIQGGDVVINVADLIVGAYFFQTRTYTGVENGVNVPEMILATHDRQRLTVTMPRPGQRTFSVFSLSGQRYRTLTNSSAIVQIDITGLAPGGYVLAVTEGHALTTKTFLVY